MKPLTAEWVEKAEADFRHINMAHKAETPGYDLVCFLAQQCAEKYIKALLQESETAFPRTHDLRLLIGLLVPPTAELDALLDRLDQLTAWAVDVRYPGFFATNEHAATAVELATDVRAICRGRLNIGDGM
jgi:HEPN domain-containing protein